MDAHTWNSTISSLPNPHLLQTWEWGLVKGKFGWEPFYKTWEDKGEQVAAALILQRTLNLPGMAARVRMHYVPKGPLLDWNNAALRTRVLADLRQFAKSKGAFLLKMDPDVEIGRGEPGAEGSIENPSGQTILKELERNGWRFSNEQVQFRNTVLVDLSPSEEQLLERMKQKTRYNVRLAERKGVAVRGGGPADFDLLFRMYAATAVRDGFTIREEGYYRAVWETFHSAGMLTPLVADVEGEAVAGLMLFHFGGRAWYVYGMSREAHREKMPTYLLQWEAMKVAKAAGCTAYDLWGAPDEFNESDSLWGVYRFKRGLGGEVVRTLGAWDLPLRPWLYRLYTQTLPRAIAFLRRRGDSRTRRVIET